MILRAIELLIAWYNGHITDNEFLEELRLTLAMATARGWNL